MNVKYKGIGRKSVAGLLLCLMGVLTACEDDFGKNGTNSGVLTMKVEVPEGWTSGVAVDEEAPDSRCVSVDAAASESSIPLYLHTIESDNTVAVPSTRGALKTTVEKFSMSAIRYGEEGDIPKLTPNFAYDLTCKVESDGTVSCPEYLQWPANGKVRFFAFALPKDSPKPFTLSGADAKGSPTITYTVPDKVADQHDLMAACADATSANVTLNFRHILTAVKVVTAKDMIPGKITKVEFSGIPNTGTYTPAPTSSDASAAQDKWEIVGTSKGTYTVKWEEGGAIGGGYQGSEDNIIGADKNGQELIGEADNRTLLMIPQTLPEGATLKVTFKEALNEHEFTLSADLKGKEWPAGKILTYSISPSSIHIKPVVEFNKKPEDILPYSGVWHDVKVRAYAEVTKEGVTTTTQYVKLPAPTIEYKFGDGTTYTQGNFYDSDGNVAKTTAKTSESLDDITADEGMYVLAAQEDFKALQGKFGDKGLDITEFKGSKDDPTDLYKESGNESANCYMVGQPGYYKFPVVYGNTYKGGSLNSTAITIENADTKKGMIYYPNYKGAKILDYKISEGENAVLAWQDSPGLIDEVEFIAASGDSPAYVSFRVRKHSITQGNALIVVRDASDVIVWSWHIWVSQHTQAWMMKNNCSEVESIYRDANDGNKYKFTGKKYQLADVNLGYCDPHDGNDGRNFKIKFKVKVKNLTIDVTQYKYADGTTVNTENAENVFTQAEFKGSLAGDNTYYQWGRSAPTPGGIYNKNTPMYYYYKKGNTSEAADYAELTMENKPLFYEGEKSYGLTSSANFTTGGFDGEKGVTIDWAIQHPYVFVMSQYETPYDYRAHWHKEITATDVPGYAFNKDSHLFQMWNPKATKVVDNVNEIEEDVVKSVYDPCPAGYIVPPGNLFSAFAYEQNNGYSNCKLYNNTNNTIGYKTSITKLSGNMEWTVTAGTQTFKFPATGVRNKSLRNIEFEKGKITHFSGTDEPYDFKTSYPAFRILTYVSSSTMGIGNQIPIFYIDNRYKDGSGKDKDNIGTPSETPGIGSYHKSSNSYGVSVRPMKEP